MQPFSNFLCPRRPKLTIKSRRHMMISSAINYRQLYFILIISLLLMILTFDQKSYGTPKNFRGPCRCRETEFGITWLSKEPSKYFFGSFTKFGVCNKIKLEKFDFSWPSCLKAWSEGKIFWSLLFQLWFLPSRLWLPPHVNIANPVDQ